MIITNQIQTIINALNSKSNIEFRDCSHDIDLCESVWNEKTDIHIYLPNSIIHNPDEDLFNNFLIIYNFTEKFGERKEVECNDVEEVVKKIIEKFGKKIK